MLVLSLLGKPWNGYCVERGSANFQHPRDLKWTVWAESFAGICFYRVVELLLSRKKVNVRKTPGRVVNRWRPNSSLAGPKAARRSWEDDDPGVPKMAGCYCGWTKSCTT